MGVGVDGEAGKPQGDGMSKHTRLNNASQLTPATQFSRKGGKEKLRRGVKTTHGRLERAIITHNKLSHLRGSET